MIKTDILAHFSLFILGAFLSYYGATQIDFHIEKGWIIIDNVCYREKWSNNIFHLLNFLFLTVFQLAFYVLKKNYKISIFYVFPGWVLFFILGGVMLQYIYCGLVPFDLE